MPKTFERGKNKPRLVPLYHLRTAFTHFMAIFELETFAFRALQVANQKLEMLTAFKIFEVTWSAYTKRYILGQYLTY